MDITIFHYHLKPGGVTQVITQSVKAILGNLSEIKTITLVAGSRENVDNELQKIEQELPGHAGRVTFEHVPEINFLDTAPATTVEDIQQKLASEYGGSLWWIHNYHLGKNPLFTEAIIRTAHDNPKQRILLHIHDFPESGRFQNINVLHRMTDSPLYPITPNIRYAVINGRDRDHLLQAGMDPNQLFLLHNPYEETHPDSGRKGQARAVLNEALRESSFDFRPEAPMLLYPVRTIRRKNILEGGFIARCSDENINLVVTLPGVSSQEKPYSEMVASCFEEQLIPGAWGIGDPDSDYNLPFSTIVSSADVIYSSSVMEGFGYLFINALSWGKPLLARDLPTLSSIKSIFESFTSYFYRQVEVPLSQAQQTALRGSYLDFLENIRHIMTPKAKAELESQIHTLTSGESIDFSFLSADLQKQVLQQARKKQFRQLIRESNSSLFSRLGALLQAEETPRQDTVRAYFSLERFAATTKAILDSFDDGGIGVSAAETTDEQQREIATTVQDSFATLENIRLLFKG